MPLRGVAAPLPFRCTSPMSSMSIDQQALEEVRVLIVDDHDLFRSGLRNLLEEEGVQIVGEASAGQEALRIVRELAPDVVVMDLNMPGMGGVEATRHISTIAPLTRVLKLIANGKDNAMIAGELHISPKTVKNHISNILMKLQIDNRIQAAVYAVRSGIV